MNSLDVPRAGPNRIEEHTNHLSVNKEKYTVYQGT